MICWIPEEALVVRAFVERDENHAAGMLDDDDCQHSDIVQRPPTTPMYE